MTISHIELHSTTAGGQMIAFSRDGFVVLLWHSLAYEEFFETTPWCDGHKVSRTKL